MRGRAKIRVAVSITGLAIGVGAGVALPRVAHELPGPLAVAVRWPERLWTRFLPPRTSLRKRLAALTRQERDATSVLARTLDGLVVWSSNRSGNHELYLLDLHRLTVRQLTHNPHVDFFSRFSPDGRRVLFLRSQREWVSFREEGAWDVMLVTTLRRHRDEMSESGSGADEVGPQIRLLPGIDYALGASLSAAGLSRQERL